MILCQQMKANYRIGLKISVKLFHIQINNACQLDGYVK